MLRWTGFFEREMENVFEITLLNAHADDFAATPVSFRLVGRRGLRKYAYLLDEPIRRGRRPAVLVDGTLSSLFSQSAFTRMPRWLRVIVLHLEVFFWLRINGLTGKIDVHWSLDSIVDRTVIYVFSYKNCVGAFQKRKATLAAFEHVVIDLSHYFIRTREKAKNIAQLPNVLLHADSDLASNPYFRKFFPGRSVEIVLPFAVGRRFSSKEPLSTRSRKCAATGSFHNLLEEEPGFYYRDFIDFFKSTTYHPIRKLIYENRAQLADWLECRVSPFRETKGRTRLLHRLRRLFKLDAVQSKYFSFDIVKFYNQHAFAIVGEELSGAPAVGFFEAMACGCVMLGQTGGYYDGLGLQAGRHFLPHDGTIESIRAAIAAVSTDADAMASIATAGIEYVHKNCSPAAVWDDFQRTLARYVKRDA